MPLPPQSLHLLRWRPCLQGIALTGDSDGSELMNLKNYISNVSISVAFLMKKERETIMRMESSSIN
jgi:hypothetical protein